MKTTRTIETMRILLSYLYRYFVMMGLLGKWNNMTVIIKMNHIKIPSLTLNVIFFVEFQLFYLSCHNDQSATFETTQQD